MPLQQAAKRKNWVVDSGGGEESLSGASAAPLKTTGHGRNVSLPSKYK